MTRDGNAEELRGGSELVASAGGAATAGAGDLVVVRSYRRRQLVDVAARGLCVAATLVALLPLASVLYYTASRGLAGLSLSFFTELPGPVGEAGGGLGNALLGSLELVSLACIFGIPVGICAGIYLAELGDGKTARLVRFGADVLAGVPSITVGIFVYSVVVLPMHGFSMLAGALALGIIMLPTVTRTTEELLRMVPTSLREAAMGLGVPKWRATFGVVLRTAAPGIVTGVMLAVARAAGETAPLLFTAFNSRYWPEAIDAPVASLPVQIFTYAVSPFEEWHRQAWAASLVLVTLVLCASVLARLATRRRVFR